jgi:RNA polymerase sigma-70 factor, ECF subfamily
MTDEEVVKAALADKQQFALLVDRYETKLQRYIRRLGVVSGDDQLDVLQEIFIKTYRNLNDFDTGLSFSSWIYRIAHNEAMSWHRKERARPTGHLVADGDEVLAWVESGELSPEETLMIQTDAASLTRALAILQPKYRDPLILRYFEHKEYEEISDILRVPIGTVGTLIHRGKAQLKTTLKETHELTS